MPEPVSPADLAKRAAARRACEYVQDGMRLGLGTGSTAAWMVRCLGERVAGEGLRITAVATSTQTAELARAVGIDVVGLDRADWLDLTIDGADEVDGALDLVKGGGGALLREKIVAAASDRMVVIADASKQVETLGAFPLPVEVIPFGMTATRSLIEEAIADYDGGGVTVRKDGHAPYVTDEGNHILDLDLRRIGDPRKLTLTLNQIPGVVENGLFVEMCDTLVLGHADGRVDVREAAPRRGDENVFADLRD